MQNHTVALLILQMSPVGLWHQALKGAASVNIEIKPSTGALIEWFDTQREGRAGIVECVSPDNKITVRSVSQAPSGTYTEHIFTEQTWKDFGPVFIRFG